MWLKESNIHFYKIENFGYGEINERSFSNPHPRTNLDGQDFQTHFLENEINMWIWLRLIQFWFQTIILVVLSIEYKDTIP